MTTCRGFIVCDHNDDRLFVCESDKGLHYIPIKDYPTDGIIELIDDNGNTVHCKIENETMIPNIWSAMREYHYDRMRKRVNGRKKSEEKKMKTITLPPEEKTIIIKKKIKVVDKE